MNIVKLLEKIEPIIKNYKRPTTVFKDRASNDSDPRLIGKGKFSRVKSTGAPDRVKKSSDVVSTGGKNDDAFWDYVDFIINEKLWKNPYFPKIYKKKTISGGLGTAHHSVEMERLEQLKNVSPKKLYQLAIQVFEKQVADDAIKKHGLLNGLAKLIEKAITSGETSFIVDPKLRQATEILHRYKVEKDPKLDITPDNIMVRKYGSQDKLNLVIADPFSFKSRSMYS